MYMIIMSNILHSYMRNITVQEVFEAALIYTYIICCFCNRRLVIFHFVFHERWILTII